MTAEADIVLPVSVLRALQRTVFVNRQPSRDDTPRVLVQLPVRGVLPYIAGDIAKEEAAIRKGFPGLSADQLKVAADALRELLKDHLRLLRRQTRRKDSWVNSW